MNSFGFRDLAREVARATGLSQTDARKAVQATLDVIGRETAAGTPVKLNNFGTFSLGDHHYNYVDLASGRLLDGTVPVVRFRVTGLLRQALRSGTPITSLRRGAGTDTE